VSRADDLRLVYDRAMAAKRDVFRAQDAAWHVDDREALEAVDRRLRELGFG